jgi:hypothetical protein
VDEARAPLLATLSYLATSKNGCRKLWLTEVAHEIPLVDYVVLTALIVERYRCRKSVLRAMWAEFHK